MLNELEYVAIVTIGTLQFTVVFECVVNAIEIIRITSSHLSDLKNRQSNNIQQEAFRCQVK